MSTTTEVFADADRTDAKAFVSHLAEDCLLRFGNADEVAGRGAIEEVIAGFFTTINGISHQIVADQWDVRQHHDRSTRGHLHAEGRSQGQIPAVAVWRRGGELIDDYRIYAADCGHRSTRRQSPGGISILGWRAWRRGARRARPTVDTAKSSAASHGAKRNRHLPTYRPHRGPDVSGFGQLRQHNLETRTPLCGFREGGAGPGNQRPPGCKPGALPTELTALFEAYSPRETAIPRRCDHPQARPTPISQCRSRFPARVRRP